MNEETFYKYATFGEPQEWNPEEHTNKRHAYVENNDGMWVEVSIKCWTVPSSVFSVLNATSAVLVFSMIFYLPL